MPPLSHLGLSDCTGDCATAIDTLASRLASRSMPPPMLNAIVADSVQLAKLVLRQLQRLINWALMLELTITDIIQ